MSDRDEILLELKGVIQELGTHHPKLRAKLGFLMGAGTVGACGVGAVTLLGETSFMSLAGISKGFAMLGSVVGGGVVSGLAIVAAPVLVGGLFASRRVMRRHYDRKKSIIYQSLGRLHRLQEHLASEHPNFDQEKRIIAAFIGELEAALKECR